MLWHTRQLVLILCACVYWTLGYSTGQQQDGEDTAPQAANGAHARYTQRTGDGHRIDIFQNGDYLTALQEIDATLQEKTHDSTTQLLDGRHKRSLDKYRVKLKDLLNMDYSVVGGVEARKRNSVHWQPWERAAVVEVLVVVDHSAFRQALKHNDHSVDKTRKYLDTYYRLLVALINARYAEIESTDLRVSIVPAAVIIQEDKASSSWADSVARRWQNADGEWEYVVDPKDVLDSFSAWLKDNRRDLPKHDHAMAFLGYRMVRRGRDSPSSGMAYVNTICQTDLGYSASVIQETWGFGNVGAAAHELGHSLGATHDGLEENIDCPAGHGYIMAPTSTPQQNYELNFFSFSPCSIKAITKTVSSSQGECLHDSKSIKNNNVDKGTRPGEWISVDQQCQHAFGETSGQCQIRNIQEPEEICQRLWCATITNDGRLGCASRGGMHAVFGTPCARNKVCYNGRCVTERLLETSSQPDPVVDPVVEEELMDSANQNLDHLRRGTKKYRSKENNNRNSLRTTSGESDEAPVEIDSIEASAPTQSSRLAHGHQSTSREDEGAPALQKHHILDRLSRYRIHSLKDYQSAIARARAGHRTRHNSHQLSTTQTSTTPVPTTLTTQTSTTTTTTAPQPARARTESPGPARSQTEGPGPDRPRGCTEDKNPTYCRSMVYSHPGACAHSHIQGYCCFSCGFYV